METVTGRVVYERHLHGWSVRRAATAGGISNTYWGGFENGEVGITETIRAGVARAFGWSPTWPEILPSWPAADQLEVRVLRLEEATRLLLRGELDAARAVLGLLGEPPEDPV
jgi:transcriptional regulator with XRE-family HTH domain